MPAALPAPLPDRATCIARLQALRWPDGFVCPVCGDRRGTRLGGCRTSRNGIPTWQCGGCQTQTSLTAGTPLHGTRLPPEAWFAAAALFSTGLPRLSDLADALAISVKAAGRLRAKMAAVMAYLVAGAPAAWEPPAADARPGGPPQGAAAPPPAAWIAVTPPAGDGQARLCITRDPERPPEAVIAALRFARRDAHRRLGEAVERVGWRALFSHRGQYSARHAGGLIAQLGFRTLFPGPAGATALLAALAGRRPPDHFASLDILRRRPPAWRRARLAVVLAAAD